MFHRLIYVKRIHRMFFMTIISTDISQKRAIKNVFCTIFIDFNGKKLSYIVRFLIFLSFQTQRNQYSKLFTFVCFKIKYMVALLAQHLSLMKNVTMLNRKSVIKILLCSQHNDHMISAFDC